MINLKHCRNWAPPRRAHSNAVLVLSRGLNVCETLKQILTRTSQALCLVVPVLIALSASGQCVLEITEQPPPSLTVVQGRFAALPCNYQCINCCPVFPQWRYNGFNLQDGQNNNYFIVNAQPFQAGIYGLVLTNGFGNSVTSTPCLLRVQPLIRNVSFSNQIFGFSFDSNAGRTNVAEWTTDLGTNAGPSWTPLLSILGDGSTVRVSDAAPPGQRRFYRVRIE